MENANIFATKDLNLAATLITLKFFMEGIDYEIDGTKNKPVGYFKFASSPLLQDACKKYSQSMLSVEPNAFSTNVRALKAEVTNIYRNPVTPYQERFLNSK